MNCRDAESQIFAARDTDLGAAAAARLAEHLQTCPQCQSLAHELAAASTAWQTTVEQVSVPNPQTEWHAVRRRIRSRPPTATSGLPSWSRLLRTAVPLAAAIAIAINFWPQTESNAPRFESPQVAQQHWDELHDHFTFVASVEFVETEDEEISPFVFLDDESGWLIVWASDVPESSSI